MYKVYTLYIGNIYKILKKILKITKKVEFWLKIGNFLLKSYNARPDSLTILQNCFVNF